MVIKNEQLVDGRTILESSGSKMLPKSAEDNLRERVEQESRTRTQVSTLTERPNIINQEKNAHCETGHLGYRTMLTNS